MRKTTTAIFIATLTILAATPVWAGVWEGTIGLGGIVLDEVGNKATVQETYNIFDGFSVDQIKFSGEPVDGNYFKLDLHEINLDSRRGDFLYRRPGLIRLTASYDQYRMVFDPERAVTSKRKDWNLGAQVTPVDWLRVSGFYNNVQRTGQRLSFPHGTESSLGDTYDYTLNIGGMGAEARRNGRGVAVDYRASDLADDANYRADRTGQVVSARLFGRGYFYDKVTHLLRGAYGVHKLANQDLDYTLKTFQYTGTVQPVRRIQFKYNFDAQSVDSQTTGFVTDRFINLVDATFYHENGSLGGGYSYEINDDDHNLTHYNSWRGEATFRNKTFGAVVNYADRIKVDEEERTLLQDIEASRFRADAEVKPIAGLVVGGGFNTRDREYPDINVEAKGDLVRGRAGYTYTGWGGVSGDYSYTQDRYTDLVGSFNVNTHIVTGRVDLDRIPNLHLSGGVTYVRVLEDLDVEKSILFFEGKYTVRNDLHLAAKYNIYNYDDYVLLDRYYTGNVVWFSVAYDLHGK